MADAPTPPPPPPDKPAARARRAPPRHVGAAKQVRSRGGASSKRATSAGAKRVTAKPKATKALAAPMSPPSPPAPPKPDAAGRFRWQAITAAGVGVLGALAGLLALRGSTPQKSRKAHQADGTDSSKSFGAGIADEGTIPEKE